MTPLDIVMISVFFLIVVIGFFLIGWLQTPWNKAKILRTFRAKKNYVVVFLRMGGGQMIPHVVPHMESVISIGDRKFTPDETCVTYKGSVPLFHFNYDDMKPIPMRGVDIEEKYRDSEYVGHVMMKMKAYYEAKALTDVMTMFKGMVAKQWMVIGGVLVCIGMLFYIITIVNAQGASIQMIGDMVNSIQQGVNPIVNQLPS